MNPKGAAAGVEVQQALCGYRDGHRILQVSTRLEPLEQRSLLALSDASGPLPSAVFSYLTGWPLPGARFFALSRTWVATEVPRPGAVWSHVYLIDVGELGRVDLNAVLGQLRRPEPDRAAFDYSSPVRFPLSRLVRIPWTSEIRALEEALYSSEGQFSPVVVATESHPDAERILFDVWLRQWPSLKAEFAFCTGAMNVRRVGERPFDLLAVPSNRIRTVLRQLDESKLVELRSGGDADGQDLPPDPNELSLLLGPELPPSRASMAATRRLAGLAGEARSTPRAVLALLQSIDVLFPASVPPSTAIGLASNAVLRLGESGGEPAVWFFSQAVPQLDARWVRILGPGLVDTPSSRAVSAFASALSRALPAGHQSSVGEALLALAIDLKTSDLLQVVEAEPEVTEAVVERRPDLVTEEALWRLSEDVGRRAMSWLQGRSRDSDEVRRVVEAQAAAGFPLGIGSLVSTFGPSVVGVFIDGLSSQRRWSVESDRTLDEVCVTPQIVLEWLNEADSVPPRLLGELVSRLLRAGIEPGDIAMRHWMTISRARNLELRVSAAGLAAAFHSNSSEAEPVISRLFGPVYQAAEDHSIESESWDLLARSIPADTSLLWGFFAPSKTRLLRRAIIDAYGEHGEWPLQGLLTAFDDPDALARAIDESYWRAAGRSVIERLGTAVDDGSVVLSKKQRTALRRVLER